MPHKTYPLSVIIELLRCVDSVEEVCPHKTCPLSVIIELLRCVDSVEEVCPIKLALCQLL